MQWSDVIKPVSEKHLRQFAGLFLVIFLGLAAWRWFGGNRGVVTMWMGGLAVVIGGVGLIAPAAVRPIYTGWMIVAFPIGWTVSRIVLGTVFYVVMTPMAWVFRLMGRDQLMLRRSSAATGTYWRPKRKPEGQASYLRQF